MKTDGDPNLHHARAEVHSRFGGDPVVFVFVPEGEESPGGVFTDLDVAWRVILEGSYSGSLRAYPSDEMLHDWRQRMGDELGVRALAWEFQRGSHVAGRST